MGPRVGVKPESRVERSAKDRGNQWPFRETLVLVLGTSRRKVHHWKSSDGGGQAMRAQQGKARRNTE